MTQRRRSPGLTQPRRSAFFARIASEWLLAVVEAGFGDLRPFNRVVRRLLQERTQPEQPPQPNGTPPPAPHGENLVGSRPLGVSFDTSLRVPVVVLEDGVELNKV